jgi:hypothetical protein
MDHMSVFVTHEASVPVGKGNMNQSAGMNRSGDSAEFGRMRNAVACFLASALYVAVVAQFGYGVLADGDTFWHLKTGEWIVQNGTVPTTDPFSHSFKGEAWIAKEWLSQVILYGALWLAGWQGVLFLTSAVVALALGLLARFCLEHYRVSIAIGVVVVMGVFASVHFLARPHMLTFPILVIWTIELVRAAEQGRLPAWWMVPLAAIWANLHGGFTFGILLAGLFALEGIISAEPSERLRALLRHGLFVVALALAALVNPYGYKVYTTAQTILSLDVALATIAEWQPLTIRDRPFHVGVVLSLIAMALLVGLRLPLTRLIGVMAISYLLFSYVRSAALFAFVLPIIVAGPISRQFPKVAAQSAADGEQIDGVVRWLKGHTRGIVAGAALLCVAVTTVPSFSRPFDASTLSFPSKALAFARERGLSGNVLNDYRDGGFLIFNNVATSIDGRAELYGEPFYSKHHKIMFAPRKTALSGFVEQYNITWALLANASPIIPLLAGFEGWVCVYTDDLHSVYAKSGASETPVVATACEAVER